MLLVDVISTAKANTRAHQKAFDGPLQSVDNVYATAVQRFAEVVATKGQISINMRLWVVANFVSEGRYENIYEYSARAAELSGRLQDEILREKLGPYFVRRTTFDNLLINGRQMQYAALNIGGIGPARYGEFCVVFTIESRSGGTPIVYLKADSLVDYTDTSGRVDVDKVRQDLAAEESKHHLAAAKHFDKIGQTPDGEWCDMLCCSDTYIEALYTGKIELGNVAEVRIAKAQMNQLWDLAFEDFSRRLAPGERALANDFIQLLGSVRARRIRMETI